MPKCYNLDVGLVLSLSPKLKNMSIADVGAGLGCYTNFFRHNNVNVADSFDFAVDIDKKTLGNVKRWDATVPYQFANRPDWIFSIEVAEHVPPEGTNGLMKNLINARCGTILSWARRGQPGRGHINCKDKDEVIELFASYNFKRTMIR